MKFKVWTEDVKEEKESEGVYNEKVVGYVEECIKHWEDICFNGCTRIGVTACRLCKEYYASGCIGCPIRDITGNSTCSDSPYYKVVRYQDRSNTDEKEKFHQAALEMLKFLTDRVLPHVKENINAEKVVYLKLKNCRNGVDICIVDNNGNKVRNPFIGIIKNDGTFERYLDVNSDYVQVDNTTKIKLSE